MFVISLVAGEAEATDAAAELQQTLRGLHCSVLALLSSLCLRAHAATGARGDAANAQALVVPRQAGKPPGAPAAAAAVPVELVMRCIAVLCSTPRGDGTPVPVWPLTDAHELAGCASRPVQMYASAAQAKTMCVATKTRQLDRLGQLVESQQARNTDAQRARREA